MNETPEDREARFREAVQRNNAYIRETSEARAREGKAARILALFDRYGIRPPGSNSWSPSAADWRRLHLCHALAPPKREKRGTVSEVDAVRATYVRKVLNRTADIRKAADIAVEVLASGGTVEAACGAVCSRMYGTVPGDTAIVAEEVRANEGVIIHKMSAIEHVERFMADEVAAIRHAFGREPNASETVDIIDLAAWHIGRHLVRSMTLADASKEAKKLLDIHIAARQKQVEAAKKEKRKLDHIPLDGVNPVEWSSMEARFSSQSARAAAQIEATPLGTHSVRTAFHDWGLAMLEWAESLEIIAAAMTAASQEPEE